MAVWLYLCYFCQHLINTISKLCLLRSIKTQTSKHFAINEEEPETKVYLQIKPPYKRKSMLLLGTQALLSKPYTTSQKQSSSKLKYLQQCRTQNKVCGYHKRKTKNFSTEKILLFRLREAKPENYNSRMNDWVWIQLKYASGLDLYVLFVCRSGEKTNQISVSINWSLPGHKFTY